MQVTPFFKYFFKQSFFCLSLVLLTLRVYSLGSEPRNQSIDSLLAVPSLNSQLINGKQYTFYVRGVIGHQFLFNDNYIVGTLTINGEEYANQRLKYDIYNQQLLLLFVDGVNAEKVLIVSDAWLTKFTLGTTRFEAISLDGSPKKIYQSIGNGEVKCLYSWKKDLKMDGTRGKSTYYFTDPLRNRYVLVKGALFRYTGNRSFIKAFGVEKSKQVSNYLRENRIKVSLANEETMEKLMDFCSSLDEN